MANPLFPFTPFDFNGIQGVYSPVEGHEKEQQVISSTAKGQDPLISMEDLRQVYPLCTDYGGYQENIGTSTNELHFFKDQQQEKELPSKSNCLALDEYFGSCFPAPAQPMQEVKRLESIIKSGDSFTMSSSLELLRNYGSGFRKLSMNPLGNLSDESYEGNRKKLSTEEIFRVAGERYIQFSDQRLDDFSMLMHPYGFALSGLSEEETRDVELVLLVFAAAEKVGHQQYDRASRLLTRCEWIASERANPVQKVVHCFTEALRERIAKATGRFTGKEIEQKAKCEIPHGLSTNMATLIFHQKAPLNQVIQLTQIQAILENTGSAKKLHVIDLQIRSGIQWTALMQALAEWQRPLEHLKITAIGSIDKHKIEEAGKRLESFAKSLKFHFTFRIVFVSSFMEIKEELFETAPDESITVVSNMFLRTMLSSPRCLENLMRVVRNLNPSLMVIGEVEANHNSPMFVNRFIEALFFYSAYFDCLETCMDQEIEHRAAIEENFSRGIRSIVAMEGKERVARSVKIDVWRAFFPRFRMVEIGFSESSIYQANWVLKQSPFATYCTLDKNGKCLIVGWKGAPLHSLSAWKFSRDRFGRFENCNF